MSEDEKKTKAEKKQKFGHVSRRDFLKDAGLMVGVPAVGSAAMLTTETQTSPDSGTVPSGTPQVSAAAASAMVWAASRC